VREWSVNGADNRVERAKILVSWPRRKSQQKQSVEWEVAEWEWSGERALEK